MAKYRRYKNGIYGIKYRSFYIQYNKDKKNFDIYDKDLNVVKSDIEDFFECEWEIIELTADEEEKEILSKTKEMSSYESQVLLVNNNREEDDDEKRKKFRDLYSKICDRKMKSLR